MHGALCKPGLKPETARTQVWRREIAPDQKQENGHTLLIFCWGLLGCRFRVLSFLQVCRREPSSAQPKGGLAPTQTIPSLFPHPGKSIGVYRPSRVGSRQVARVGI
eukprot:3797771-Amphidinium_carterae.2